MGLEITRERIALLNQDLNGECFFEINDLEDEKGNATGTRVFLKIKPTEIPAESISEAIFKKITNK